LFWRAHDIEKAEERRRENLGDVLATAVSLALISNLTVASHRPGEIART
jgi:hypothetical protein